MTKKKKILKEGEEFIKSAQERGRAEEKKYCLTESTESLFCTLQMDGQNQH